jgi:hypothetical protein
MQISATTEEMIHLAKRFSLPNITALHADLILSRAVDRQDTFSSSKGGDVYSTALASCIHVEGTVQSSCVQTCVRTNELFSVDKDFRLVALVRPCSPNNIVNPTTSSVAVSSQTSTAITPVKQKSQRTKKQQQQQLKLVQSFMDHGQGMSLDSQPSLIGEDIMEDEGILGEDGIFDVGELVAQMFRVKLDPYPKKPGTTPVSYTITG